MNTTTFEMFVAMEYNLRQHIHQGQIPNLEHIITSISENEDVLFLWSLISADWEESSASALLEMVVRHWVRVRGFSYANTWLEKYKVAHAETDTDYAEIEESTQTANFQP